MDVTEHEDGELEWAKAFGRMLSCEHIQNICASIGKDDRVCVVPIIKEPSARWYPEKVHSLQVCSCSLRSASLTVW